MRSGIFFIVFLLSISLQSFSQQYNFRNYSVGEGLAQSQVYTMLDDGSGYLWFGTRGGGISRFDGIHFVNYTVKEGLPSNYVRSLCHGESGVIWIGTDEGLSSFDGKKFQNYGLKEGLYNVTINAMVSDKNSVIWLATEKGIFHKEGDTIYRFGRKLNLPLERFNCLYEDAEGNMWAGSEKGLYKFSSGKNGWIYELLTTKEGLPGNIITSVFEDNDHKIWVTTYGGGVGKKDENGWTIFHMKNGLGSNTVYSGCRGKGSSLWFGTSNGVTQCDTAGGQYSFRNYTDTEGLPNNVVMVVMKDSFSNLWMGTSGGGISKLGSERFMHFTAIENIFGTWVYAIHQDPEGNFWFGTSEGGVTKYDGKYYKRFSEKQGFTSSKVRTIHQDKQGNLWFGTIADGAFLYDGKGFRHFNIAKGLSSNFINSIVSDSTGRIFLATAGGGISCLYPKGKNFKVIHIKLKDGLPGDRVNVLFYDNNFLWAGMAGKGICRIIPPNDSFPVQIRSYEKQDGLTSGSIRAIARRNDGIIFFGTADAGIIAYKDSAFITISTDQGLTSDNIYSLLLDNDQHLWAGTEKGLDRIILNPDLSVNKITHFGKPEGFIGIETIQNSSFIDKDGCLWFGSVKCASRYDAQKDTSVRSPLIKLTGIRLFFDPIEKTDYGRKINFTASQAQQLDLPYDKNHLSFEFIGIEHTNPEAVKYQWVLEGFDKTWTPVSYRSDATYSNIPPGNYVFKVKALSESGLWSGTKEIYITIHPPFWNTLWFYTSCFLILVFLLWYFVSARYRKIRKKSEQERERLEMERNLLQLEQKALRLQMNPHFLFNCLNSIKGLIAEGKDEEAKLYLSRFSRLMRSILENSGGAFISLSDEIAALKNYVDLEKLNLGDKLEMLVELDKQLDPDLVGIPSMVIQPFVENSIIHGLAPKEGKGWVKISFIKEEDHIRCRVVDNGIGREEAGKLKSPSLSSHKSAAISITQDRLNLINKKLNFEQLKIVMTDRKEEGSGEGGTMVEIILPYEYL